LSLIFVYFLLSAQYESYLVPLSILLSLPVGVAGAIGFVYLAGLENNIYFRSLMLIGLLAKMLLIVEFAIQRRRNGMFDKAAIEGRARLRILMTSLAFIFGLLPLALASGEVLWVTVPSDGSCRRNVSGYRFGGICNSCVVIFQGLTRTLLAPVATKEMMFILKE
jgi:HAE1 family hydrophobic/amphiphilic exporter-1